MRRVLIVDDSSSIRTALRWMVKEQGWDVCGEASNGAEGISAAGQLKPDVVVLDFCMPVMNGIDAAVQIKRLNPAAHLLMFTSYVGPRIEKAARLAGVEAFVEKGTEQSSCRPYLGLSRFLRRHQSLCST
ncbi:MAG: response regulator transcription factor [Candidatus Acidiferrales bacterium]